jgi:hypothetical protein
VSPHAHEAASAAAVPRRIAVLAPMPSELRPLVPLLGLRRSDAGLLRGRAGACDVVAAQTGIGMEAGARAASRILDATKPDHLVVVGIAGGIGARVSIGDVVVPERVLDLETGDAFAATALAGVPMAGTLASSDRLIEDPTEAGALGARGVVAIDMETAAIASVCADRGAPWTAFRAISDRADDGTTDAAILGLVGPDGRPKPAAVLHFLLSRPHRIPQLVRLARGSAAATRAAARAAASALETASPSPASSDAGQSV